MTYRIGTTSFIYRGTYLENVERLASRVDDIELLFFDITKKNDLPSSIEKSRLKEIKEESHLTYTIHTPLDVFLGDHSESIRNSSIDKLKRTVDLAESLEPFAYTVHVDPGDLNLSLDLRQTARWLRRVEDSLVTFLKIGISPRHICIESLDRDFGVLDPILERLDLSVTLDLGHVQRDKGDQEAYLGKYLDRARIIQIHGTPEGGRDHQSLRHYPKKELDRLLHVLREEKYSGVVTLEVFSEKNFEDSLSYFNSRQTMKIL